MVTAKTPGMGACLARPLAFVFYFCSSAAVYILGGQGKHPPFLVPRSTEGRGAGEVGTSSPPPPSFSPSSLPPSPRPGAVYYCERINREGTPVAWCGSTRKGGGGGEGWSPPFRVPKTVKSIIGLTAAREAAFPGGGWETGPLNVFQSGGGWQLENSSHARLKTCQVARPVAERLGDPLTGAPKASLGSECRGWNGTALFQGCWGHRA